MSKTGESLLSEGLLKAFLRGFIKENSCWSYRILLIFIQLASTSLKPIGLNLVFGAWELSILPTRKSEEPKKVKTLKFFNSKLLKL
jgi:hypothetical protein